MTEDAGQRYERHKEAAREAQAGQSKAGRDIGPPPPPANPERRERSKRSCRLFCETYLAHRFPLPWSPDHLEGLRRAERAVLAGELFAYAMPRGSGKSTMACGVELWAALHALRRFVVLLGSDRTAAVEALENVKSELETNPLLLADFPEVCYPIHELEGLANRAKGQLCDGMRTRIVWGREEIVLPTIAGSAASGCVIRARGILARIRGMNIDSRRPDLVIPDDPQTDASARSLGQVKKRMAVLNGAVLGLAGPDKTIAGLMPCTVIQPGDMADQILDRDKYPQWNGLRTKLVYAWPAREDLWEQYATLRADDMRQNTGAGAARVGAATAFYAAHRAEMDAGAKVGWAERFDRSGGELSALQHATNLRLDLGQEAFDAEYQNDPKAELSDVVELPFDAICAKCNGIPRGIVPNFATDLTAMVDVHDKLLYWMVGAFDRSFTGHIVDYRAFPDQRRPYFRMTEAKRTLAAEFPGARLEGRVHAGLDAVVNQLMAAEWAREDGGAMQIGRIFIDSAWGQTSDVVKDFCRRSRHAAIVLPCQGKGITAAQTPMAEWQRHEGESHGFHYVLRRARKPSQAKNGKKKRATGGGRLAILDTNFWKSFVHDRLAVARGDRGGLTLFGDDPQQHLMLAHHARSESRHRKAVPGRIVDEWFLSPDKPDNHLLDCLTGVMAAAAERGCLVAVPKIARRLTKKRPKPPPRRSRVHYAD
jgi:hypothetical protein